MADKEFMLEVIRPDRIFYTGNVRMVEFNTTEGEVGIYAGHIPMTQIIAPGKLIITDEKGERAAALLSGFAEIGPDRVEILAEACEWPEDIDRARAEEARIRAERKLTNPDGHTDLLQAELALKRALIRLSISERH